MTDQSHTLAVLVERAASGRTLTELEGVTLRRLVAEQRQRLDQARRTAGGQDRRIRELEQKLAAATAEAGQP